MPSRRLTALAVAACFALGATACGDDEDEPTPGPVATATTEAPGGSTPATSTPPEPATTTAVPADRAEFVRQATAACERIDDASDDIEEPRRRTAATASTYFGKLLPLAERLVEDHEALTPPAELKAGWDRFLAAEKEATAILRSALEKARADDPAFAQEIQRIGPAGDRIDRAAKAAGLEDC